ncbi:sorting nexin-7 isoform X1 [Hydra vulgaris]|uniref:sorting nexin-7 isoform X1 n=2 Tax=Hydra vulgaris TaxID=6087 RepID=UPI001F5F7A23|nr:sorting nexin-7 isoform X1 [Hydra vulgaris]
MYTSNGEEGRFPKACECIQWDVKDSEHKLYLKNMMDSYMNWRMFVNEDNLVGNDRIYNKFLDIYVLHPRTHIRDGKALYTDYEVHVKTNHPEFAIKESNVRRRYSDFVWLKTKLGVNDIMMSTAPSLPGKRYFGRFKDQFLKHRQLGLQLFLNKVVEINAFLTDSALHLFLQTELSRSQMDKLLQQGVHLSNIRDKIIMLQKSKIQKEKTVDSEQLRFYNFKTCDFKRSISVDNIIVAKKVLNVPKDDGRGWSQYIGDGNCTWEVTSKKDSTDYYAGHVKKHCMTATACVLPSGQLRLPEDYAESRDFKSRQRSASWHGKTTDLIELFLDGYDVITAVPPDTCSDSDEMSVSYSSHQDEMFEESSDDGIEIDISKKLEVDLSEYTVVPLPSAQTFYGSGKIRSSNNGFHHSYSGSYGQS